MTNDKANERAEAWAGELQNDTQAETDPMPQSAWDVERIQEHWHPNQVRLPPYLQRRFDGHFGRVEWLLTQASSDREFKKDRHYKPLVVALGLQQLQTMEADEIETALDDVEQNQLVE